MKVLPVRTGLDFVAGVLLLVQCDGYLLSYWVCPFVVVVVVVVAGLTYFYSAAAAEPLLDALIAAAQAAGSADAAAKAIKDDPATASGGGNQAAFRLTASFPRAQAATAAALGEEGQLGDACGDEDLPPLPPPADAAAAGHAFALGGDGAACVLRASLWATGDGVFGQPVRRRGTPTIILGTF